MFLVAGAAVAALAWLTTPHGRETQTAGELVAKLLAFACLCVAIAFFPWVSQRLQWLVYIPFALVFFGLALGLSWYPRDRTLAAIYFVALSVANLYVI